MEATRAPPHDRLPMLGPMKTPWLLTENEFDSLFWCPLGLLILVWGSLLHRPHVQLGLAEVWEPPLSNGTEPLAC